MVSTTQPTEPAHHCTAALRTEHTQQSHSPTRPCTVIGWLCCTAQCGHAAVGVVDDMRRSGNELYVESLLHWERKGAMKIALRVDSEEQLMTLEAQAESLQLPNCLIVDAGHTQIAPNTRTVLAIGPAPVETIDEICGQLKLL